MKKRQLKDLKLRHLALVKRGANKVNRAILKSDRYNIDDFFAKGDTSDDEQDSLIKAGEVIDKLVSIYNSGDLKAGLEAFLLDVGAEIPAGEDDDPEEDLVEVTAEDLINEI